MGCNIHSSLVEYFIKGLKINISYLYYKQNNINIKIRGVDINYNHKTGSLKLLKVIL